jgi:hypothetical protein
VLQGSARRRDLLRYLVEETLAGRGGQLKGYSVALAVFARDESFDPASDPVVRLEAGRLRRALDTYYVDADRRDELRIRIPKGAYVADFERQGRDPSAQPDEDVIPDVPGLEPGDDAASTAPVATGDEGTAPRHRRPAFLLAALLSVALGVLGLWLWPRAAPDEADPRGPAIIVLPFEAMDQREDTRLLASAMTQDLVSDLMRFPDLRL